MIRFRKGLVTLGLIGGLAVSSLAGTAEASGVHYKDVKETDNYYSAVESLLEQKAISSTLDSFKPNESITRGQMASILVKALDLDISDVKNPNFKDVPTTHQFYPYIAKLANEGILGGKSDGTFGIDEPLTRGQMSVILTEAFDIPLVSIYDVELEKFKDLYEEEIRSISAYVYTSLSFKTQFARHAYTMDYFGFASGYPKEERFGINDSIKRSQFALMLKKLQEHEGTQAFFDIQRYNAGPATTSFDATKNGAIKEIQEFIVEDESIVTVDSYITNNEILMRPTWEDYSTKMGFNTVKALNDYVVFNLHKEGKTFVDLPTLKQHLIVEVVKEDGKLVAKYSFEKLEDALERIREEIGDKLSYPAPYPVTTEDSATVTE